MNDEDYKSIFLSVYDSLLSSVDYDILCTTNDEHADHSKRLAQIAHIYTVDILNQLSNNSK